MTLELNIVPGRTITRDEFLATHPRFSIALDGYVYGQPFFLLSPQGPYRNFNHHEAVDRSCTCATCEQVRRAVLLGLYELYADEHGAPHAHFWVNDCDQDVCLATWILMNPSRAGEPMVRSLTHAEDLLDMSGGGLAMAHEQHLLGHIRWIFEPYTARRPELTELGADDMRDIIDTVHQRIDAFLRGESRPLALQGGYQELHRGEGWILVAVDHQHARQKLVTAGNNACIELYARSGEQRERYVYAIWRRSEYIVSFPVREILRELNLAEGLGPDDVSGWGGSENIGGSPRGVGSTLEPERVAAVVDAVVARHRHRVWTPS